MAESGLFHAVVPLKVLVTAKSRLASGLDPSERIELVHRMLQKVTHACQGARLIGEITIVVEGDLPDAWRIPAGMRLLRQEPTASGLNEGLRAALDRLGVDEAGRAGVAIVMADLPHLTADALDAALGCMPAGRGALVATDQHAEGTSLLAWRGGMFRSVSYGDGSRRAHLSALREAGFDPVDLPPCPAFHDLDTPADAGSVTLRAVRPLWRLELTP